MVQPCGLHYHTHSPMYLFVGPFSLRFSAENCMCTRCTSAITVILLPFVGLGLFLLRRNFQRGGVSRNLAAGLARKMAERAGGAGGGGGGVSGGGGGGVPWMHQSPTEGALSSLLAIMLGGMSGTELVSVLRRCGIGFVLAGGVWWHDGGICMHQLLAGAFYSTANSTPLITCGSLHGKAVSPTRARCVILSLIYDICHSWISSSSLNFFASAILAAGRCYLPSMFRQTAVGARETLTQLCLSRAAVADSFLPPIPRAAATCVPC